jgi:hypothetical protein
MLPGYIGLGWQVLDVYQQYFASKVSPNLLVKVAGMTVLFFRRLCQ